MNIANSFGPVPVQSWVARSFTCAVSPPRHSTVRASRRTSPETSGHLPGLAGNVSETRVAEGAPLDSFVYTPAAQRPTVATLISVHGVTRQVREQLTGWATLADRLGLALVAPHFGEVDHQGYQRLAARAGEPSSDIALLRLLDRLRTDGRLRSGPVYLFGFSGGAQFVHRFAMAHPEVSAGVIVASAGYYTFPDRLTPFPYGLATRRSSLDLRLEEFLRIPLLVVVGEADVHRDRRFRRRTWLDLWQGHTRAERAERWAEALRREAERRGIPPNISFLRLPGAGHSFLECMPAGLLWHAGTFLADRLGRAPSNLR